ncbi:MAG TPA: isoprenylcysteine carboxylmethyltransferase family protein [Candidatus Sulfotelmatobacter sp.]|jgi:protein-S-isoprenylcysteine O-methyltransferase Ste14|nr:isoprenylcysteine carboxylmethyltransferase family protein [Candidatus Sulfotelmatobacter sp.]
MLNTSNIIFVCWLIFLGYWIINWKSVKPTHEAAWRAPRFRWIFLWIIILLLLLHSIFPSYKTTPAHFSLIVIAGMIVTIIGLTIAIIARKTLADNWSSDVELKKNHKLIITGIYSYARHPIYTGIITMGIGTIITLQSIHATSFSIGMIAFMIFKMKKEEKLLLKHFPKEYSSYQKKTKALFPFLY